MKKIVIVIGTCLTLALGGCTGGSPQSEHHAVVTPASETETAIVEIVSAHEEMESADMVQTEADVPQAKNSSPPVPTLQKGGESGSTTDEKYDVPNKAGSAASSNIETAAPASDTRADNSGNSSAANDPNAGRIWHEAVYEDVWVVDKPTRVVEEPVYEMRERTYCFICDIDITGNIPAHGDDHSDRDEDFQYGGKLVQVQTGVKSVTILEEGHWEQKLVRAAGWY